MCHRTLKIELKISFKFYHFVLNHSVYYHYDYDDDDYCYCCYYYSTTIYVLSGFCV